MPRVLWSYSAGRRASGDRPSSTVRVFERADAPGRIYLERGWIDGEGRTRALKHGTTRSAARNLAEKTANVREEDIIRGRDAYGERKGVGLFELLAAYHDPRRNRKARDWSKRHQLEQERAARFWKGLLGDVPVTAQELPTARIEALAGDAAEAKEWSERTEGKYLKYLGAATRWGWRKAKLLREDPLMGLEIPEAKSDTRRRVYSVDEARLLMTPHPEVDWRVTLAFALSVVHGRRISAILHLWVGLDGHDQESDVAELEVEVIGGAGERVVVERMFLHYRAEHDKGGRDEWVPVPPQVRRQIERAMQTREVRESGWLFPEGRLGFADPRDKPIRADSMIDALHRAEDTLGVSHVPGRGYHGGKRLHVTKALQVAGGDAARVGDVTGNVSEHVLKTIYRQRELGQVVAQVDAVAAILEGKPEPKTDTKKDREERA